MAGAFKKSDVEILLSTMNRADLDFLEPMFPFAHYSDFSILIINQTTQGNELVSPYENVRVVNVYERGLSRSRNLAVQHASKKIGLIADDDLVFLEGFDEKVAKGFNHFPVAAAVKFITVTFGGIPFRKYPKEPVAVLSDLQRLNSTSWEIALNIAQVLKSGISFNTNFGLGSAFPLGEEPVLMNALYKAGYAVSHYPETTVSHKEFKDSDNISLHENYRIRGAYLYEIFRQKFLLWLGIQLAYDLKAARVKPWQIYSCLKSAYAGKNQLLKIYENIA
ncbi:MAG: glycosyltransferase [Bacteroidia bacterium]